MADIILYTCAHLPPEDPSWRPGSESLEDVLNGESRAGKTLAFVMPSVSAAGMLRSSSPRRWCAHERREDK